MIPRFGFPLSSPEQEVASRPEIQNTNSPLFLAA